MTMMTYKGYEAAVEYDEDAGIFHGEVINLRDVVTFQGKSVTRTPWLGSKRKPPRKRAISRA
jgi:predicted HicB family RNase H-like nuclease